MYKWGLVILLTIGCSSQPTVDSQTDEKKIFQTGARMLTKEDFSGAKVQFSELLKKYPATRWLPQAFYNLGLAHEGLKEYPQAAEMYTKVVDHYRGLHTRDEIEALYRLSICYEALEKDEKNLLALLQLENGAQHMPKNTLQVEVPARIAAAYARLGNDEQARKYFARSQDGLKSIRRLNLGKDALIWLPKTYYSMGHIVPVKRRITEAEEYKNYLAALEQSQVWLLKATEMANAPDWSQKAGSELLEGYKVAWQIIEEYPLPNDADKLQAEKKKQETQKKMASYLDAVIEKLKVDRAPMASEKTNAPLANLMKGVTDIQKKVDALISARDVQDLKTPEAQKREGLKQEGRIRD